MNTFQRPVRATMRQAHPVEYVKRRLSSITIVGAAVTGLMATAAAESAGLPHAWALSVGVGAFAGLSVFMTELGPRLKRMIG
jgi:hypothetical protein